MTFILKVEANVQSIDKTIETLFAARRQILENPNPFTPAPHDAIGSYVVAEKQLNKLKETAFDLGVLTERGRYSTWNKNEKLFIEQKMEIAEADLADAIRASRRMPLSDIYRLLQNWVKEKHGMTLDYFLGTAGSAGEFHAYLRELLEVPNAR